MEWTHVYENTMLRGTEEAGDYIECKYVKNESGENDIDATKQKILDHRDFMEQLTQV
tara:strand:- start:617 stop:787 length:171 start_codon:yes stop_codon:yes gene_type:complete